MTDDGLSLMMERAFAEFSLAFRCRLILYSWDNGGDAFLNIRNSARLFYCT
jgi:hypothetical protein